MNVKIETTWKEVLKDEFEKDYFKLLTEFVRESYKLYEIYPSPKNIFRAFDLCPFSKVKVVILGQDPYHGKGQAHGLSFSVPEGVQHPPSLVNIFKEIKTDIGIEPPISGDLTRWAEQGILLLNATLTVEASKAGSHQNRGWEIFTDSVIRELNRQRSGIVYILWGAYAQRKGEHIDATNNLVLTAPHPSPLSSYRGFFDSKPFSKANSYFRSRGEEEINW